jgi:hypothetical protein
VPLITNCRFLFCYKILHKYIFQLMILKKKITNELSWNEFIFAAWQKKQLLQLSGKKQLSTDSLQKCAWSSHSYHTILYWVLVHILGTFWTAFIHSHIPEDSNLNEVLFSTHPLFCYIENIHIYGEGCFFFCLQVDNITAYLHHCLTNKNLLDKVNVVLLSDHGMASVIPQNIYNLTQYVNKAFFEIVDSSLVLQIYPSEGISLSVYCSNLYIIISARTFHGTFLFENTHIPWILIFLIYIE